MLSRTTILFALVLLLCLLAHSADASDALRHYHTRLDEIARSYNRQFSEIRQRQRRVGSEKTNLRFAEREIEQLGVMRSAAIAEAKLIYEKEQREQKQTDLAPAAKLSGEQRQREFWAARLQAVEDGQKAFWDRVAREEPKVAELRTARLQAIEEQQAAFWAGLPLREAKAAELMATRREAVEKAQNDFWAELFGAPERIPHDRSPLAATHTSAQRVESHKPSVRLSSVETLGIFSGE